MSDFKITPRDWNIDGAKLGVKPGDRLILQGPRAEIQFHNVRGTKEAPITITATEKTLIKAINPGSKVVQFFNCDYLYVTGGPDMLLEITGGAHGIEFGGLSNHTTFSFLHIHHTGATGIGLKTYPTCDKNTWRGAFTMEDTSVINCIIENVGTEGIYYGCSHHDKSFPLTNCPGVTSALEHDVVNATIRYNIVRNCGMDGIQLGSAIEGENVISNNDVYNTGTAMIYGQASGIQANPGSKVTIEDNIVDTCTSFGIILQGRMGTIVRRNVIKNTVGGIMTVARENDPGAFLVENNTFIDITGNAVQYYNNTTLRNNIIQMKAGVLIKKMGGTLTDVNNIKQIAPITELKLDPETYLPTAESKLPPGVGIGDYVKPKPVVTKEAGSVELITTGGIEEWYLTTPSGKRKKME